jgi:histidyl-tRNA synthetase
MLYPNASTKLRSNMDDFITTCRMLSDLQCKYEINLKIIRNFEYYTGIYFQFLIDDTKVAGGGRYDDLISLIGGDTHPACGFALYVDSIQKIIAIDKDNEYSKSIVIKGIDTSHEIIKKCYTLARELRSQEYTVDVRFTNAIPSCCWEITVSNELPCSFSLVNSKLQKYTAGSLEEIIKVLNR